MKTISYEVDVKGNPFVKITPTTKYFILMQKQPYLISLRLYSQFRGIPYADSFNAEEQYLLFSMPMQPIDSSQPYSKDVPSHKCLFRMSSQIIFHKNIPFLKSKIEKGSLEKGQESFTVWNDWASTKIEEYRELNPLPKL